MSTGGGAVDVEPHDVDANSSAGSTGGKTNASTLLTPRFTQEEKEILYSLFHQHEEVIDIKFRKKQRSKYSVREAWEQIVREFNSHPGTSAARNLKQIQKFWLNARLRKQYPFGSSAHKTDAQNQMNDAAIKDEPEFQMTTTQTSDQNDQSETFEEIEMETSGGVAHMDDDPIETHEEHQQQVQQHQQHHHQQQHQQQQQLQVHVQHQPQNGNGMQTQQISVDQISAEKLTLNDLLQFKPSRSHQREEIILQIKHPDNNPTQITIPGQQTQHTMATITASGYNQQILSELKPQPITLTHFQPQTQQMTTQQLQQQHLVQQTQQPQLQQVKLQLQSPAATQFSTATPTFTCTSYNSAPTQHMTTAVNATPTTATSVVNNVNESYEDKINYFRLKEAELRFKEQQLALEKKKIELNRAQEELKDMRELHRLQLEEKRMKIRVLQEEEKQLRKRHAAEANSQ